jgi:hypothetical protein
VLGTTAEGQRVGLIPNFLEHQRVDRAIKSPFKAKTITWDDGEEHSSSPRRALDESSTQEVELEREREGSTRKARSRKTAIPENFKPSDRMRKWAQEHGVTRLEEHCESFVVKCRAKDYRYAAWDSAFMAAVRDDWAKLGKVVPIRDEFAGCK